MATSRIPPARRTDDTVRTFDRPGTSVYLEGLPLRTDRVLRGLECSILSASCRLSPRQHVCGTMVLGPHQQRYPMQKLTPEIIHAAIDGFEAQKRKIDSQIAELRAMLNGGPASPAAKPATTKKGG